MITSEIPPITKQKRKWRNCVICVPRMEICEKKRVSWTLELGLGVRRSSEDTVTVKLYWWFGVDSISIIKYVCGGGCTSSETTCRQLESSELILCSRWEDNTRRNTLLTPYLGQSLLQQLKWWQIISTAQNDDNHNIILQIDICLRDRHIMEADVVWNISCICPCGTGAESAC